jgi:Tfp pilus assembly protein PilF
MAFPPYLDQLEHTQRQSQADQAIKNRRQRLTQADLRQVVAMYTAALARAPDDWQLHHNFGKFCFTIGDFRSAAEHLAIEAGVFPGSISSRMGYGVALMRAGRTEDAIAQFDAVLRIDPACEPARKALESIMSRRSAPGS